MTKNPMNGLIWNTTAGALAQSLNPTSNVHRQNRSYHNSESVSNRQAKTGGRPATLPMLGSALFGCVLGASLVAMVV